MKKLLFFPLLLSIPNSIYSVEPDLYEILREINKVVSSVDKNARNPIQPCVDTIMQIPIGIVASNPTSFSWNEKKVEKGISHLELLQITPFVEAILCHVAQIKDDALFKKYACVFEALNPNNWEQGYTEDTFLEEQLKNFTGSLENKTYSKIILCAFQASLCVNHLIFIQSRARPMNECIKDALAVIEKLNQSGLLRNSSYVLIRKNFNDMYAKFEEIDTELGLHDTTLLSKEEIKEQFFAKLPKPSLSVIHNLPQEENGETKESSSTVGPKLLKTMVPLVVVPAFGYYVATTNQTQTEKLVDVIKQHPKKSVAGLGVIIFGGATILGYLGW